MSGLPIRSPNARREGAHPPRFDGVTHEHRGYFNRLRTRTAHERLRHSAMAYVTHDVHMQTFEHLWSSVRRRIAHMFGEDHRQSDPDE